MKEHCDIIQPNNITPQKDASRPALTINLRRHNRVFEILSDFIPLL